MELCGGCGDRTKGESESNQGGLIKRFLFIFVVISSSASTEFGVGSVMKSTLKGLGAHMQDL